ncbi:MAG: PAS domain-containing protein, partial [Chloroflexi bacterium]|nr:PAS domain-containing protein [Chloroflexota bacterium]
MSDENPDPVFRISRAGLILYANPAGIDHLKQFAVEHMLHAPPIWYDTLHEILQKREKMRLDYTNPASGQSYSALFVPLLKDGYINVYVVEMTALRQTEAQCRAQQIFVQRILDTSPNFVTVQDCDGRYVHVNQAFLKFLALTAEAVVGKQPSEIISPNFEQSGLAQLASEEQGQVSAAPNGAYADQRLFDAQGNCHWFQVTKLPLPGPDGKCEHVLTIFTDVTVRKQAEDALQKHDRLLRAVAEATDQLLTATDYAASVNGALQILGQALEIDRVYLFENYPHPTTGQMVMSRRFEWMRPS